MQEPDHDKIAKGQNSRCTLASVVRCLLCIINITARASLASLCRCTGSSVSNLVGSMISRFSRDRDCDADTVDATC